MPNTGRPSKDCHLCRSRRVKCDLGRPQCQRCIKYGVSCPGYRDIHELVFREVNPVTPDKRRQYQRQHEQYQRRKNAGVLHQPSLESSVSSSPQASASPFSSHDSSSTPDLVPDDELAGTDMRLIHPPSMPKSLTPHWTSQSIPIVLNMYPAIQMIQHSYQKCDRDGPLVWVAHLLARTYVVNLLYPTCIGTDSVSESRKMLGNYWGKTLSAISRILKEPEGSLRDDVLVTIWLLANYELLIGSLNPYGGSPWNMHIVGLYGLLKARPLQQLMSPRWRLTSFWPAYNLVQVQAVIMTTECPAETDKWLALIRETMIPAEAQLVATAAFLHRMTIMAAGIVKVIRTYAFEDAAEQYHYWVAELADAQLAVEEELLLSTGVETASLRASMTSIRNAALIKTSQLFTLLVEFLTHWPKCPVPEDDMILQRESCVLACCAAADSILSFVPDVLGSLNPLAPKSPKMLFDAVRLIWPLMSVCETPSTTPEQRREGVRVLAYMADEMGVRQARVRISLSWENLDSCRTPDLFLTPDECRTFGLN